MLTSPYSRPEFNPYGDNDVNGDPAGPWPAPTAGSALGSTLSIPGSKSLTNRYLVLAAPSGVPKEVVDQLYGHLREIIKDPKVLERITGAGFIPMMNSPQAFRDNYQRDMPVWKALVEQAGAKLD